MQMKATMFYAVSDPDRRICFLIEVFFAMGAFSSGKKKGIERNRQKSKVEREHGSDGKAMGVRKKKGREKTRVVGRVNMGVTEKGIE